LYGHYKQRSKLREEKIVTMSFLIGILSILIAFGMLIYFSFKGFSIIWLAPICALVVIVLNGMDPYTAISQAFMGGFSGVVAALFPIFFLAILMGRIYTDSNAAMSIAKTLMHVFARNATGEKKQLIAIIICGATGFALAYGGIDTFCVLFTLFPVILSISEQADIPRRFMIGIMCIGVTAAAVCPGAPLVSNYIPMPILGTPSTAALIPGIIGSAIIFIGCCWTLFSMVKKAGRNGEHFSYGSISVPEDVEGRKYPSFLFSILPIVFVVAAFDIFKLNLVYALAIGLIASLILLPRYFVTKPGESIGRALINTLNEGGRAAAEAMAMLAIMVGFAAVVQSAPVFQTIIDGVTNLPVPALFIVLISTGLIVAITGSPPAGLQIILPILAGTMTNVSPEAMHRVASMATQTLDLLPFQGAIIIMLGMAGLSHKEGYSSVFRAEVVWGCVAAIVVTVMLTLFPALG
jgi:H+/gluconate symporter-like permease